MKFDIPLKIVSVQNVSQHWRAVARRRQSEREAVNWLLACRSPPDLPLRVTLTRIAPRPLDSHDNLRAGFKAPVDAIAEWLGVKDNDDRISWNYAQERGKPREYACRVEFALRHYSSCAVHNEPAYPAGPCDCGAIKYVTSMEEAIAALRT